MATKYVTFEQALHIFLFVLLHLPADRLELSPGIMQ